ncbi:MULTISPECIES: hypothetical protein [unclassified Mycobacterium]|uniref:hypothetical protein n=1 Tax=unclassified Mycobacterium TaxID=2642494 RepID=UPI0029C6A14C|nr:MULTISPECIES: hypothetical protein [unclassified Mycobacterium]
MFVRIAIDQTVSLHEADDLRRLHVEIAGLDGAALTSAVRRHRLGRVDGDGDVELRVATLVELAGDRDQHWADAFADMLGYAKSKGWMSDSDHVRAHCVRIPAVPFDQAPR